jgi:hypothetical protein
MWKGEERLMAVAIWDCGGWTGLLMLVSGMGGLWGALVAALRSHQPRRARSEGVSALLLVYLLQGQPSALLLMAALGVGLIYLALLACLVLTLGRRA